jgi:hypothetical protein
MRNTNTDPTKEQIHKLFEYRDGMLIWKVKKGCCRGIGERAGSFKDKGYRQVMINSKLREEHRIIYIYHYGEIPTNMLVDHKNGNPSDNNIDNLRLATDIQNCQNQKISKNNTSGYKGVCFKKDRNKWHAGIRVNGIIKHLGYYDTPKIASEVYKKAAEIYFKEFAKI